MQKRDTLFIGFMLFALFFGAGNLIYPPFLGYEAGTSFWKAIGGFVITGVGLPIMAVAAIALVRGGANALGSRVSPLFGLVFTAVVYLAIGPFFGIPRGANVAYEMAVKPFTETGGFSSALALFLFTVVFFLLSYWVSLNPTRLVDRIGQLLTPVLLISITALVAVSFVKLDAPLQPASEKYQSAPFFTGLIEGYLTMDTIAAFAFAILVVTAVTEKGVSNHRTLMGHTVRAGLVAGAGLAAVYISIGWLGAKMASLGSFTNGSEILSAGANLLFGSFGGLLLGAIVALACFTTVVGLTTASAQYFSKQFPKLGYKNVVTLVSIVSFLIANLGLNQIIAYSVPVLVAVYPLAIVLVLLAYLHNLFGGTRYVYSGAMLATGIVSVYDGLKMLGLESEYLTQFLGSLPLASLSLAWVMPAAAGGAAGFLLSMLKKDPASETANSRI
ncbi:branched-chain amino acid transport system II carrier protein [Bacillus marinisedimentorum]|uniref:branched-chain amino acid transport system II carrier protein n=1 Tax=Bacillus marinisedimentorum TaxID=1821260 RepID=UPI0007E0C592|nr:branched-chain amino acid transport system II carrier protein [Bacillus marinisedimentorum]